MHNIQLIKSVKGLNAAIKEQPNSPVSYGSKFRPVALLSTLIHRHSLWTQTINRHDYTNTQRPAKRRNKILVGLQRTEKLSPYVSNTYLSWRLCPICDYNRDIASGINRVSLLLALLGRVCLYALPASVHHDAMHLPTPVLVLPSLPWPPRCNYGPEDDRVPSYSKFCCCGGGDGGRKG